MWRGVFDPSAVYNVDTPMAAKETRRARLLFLINSVDFLLALQGFVWRPREEEQGLSFFCFSAVLIRGASSFNTHTHISSRVLLRCLAGFLFYYYYCAVWQLVSPPLIYL